MAKLAGLTALDVRRWTGSQPRSDDRTKSQPRSDRDEAIGRTRGHWTRPPAIGRKSHPLATTRDLATLWAASGAARSRAATARSAWIPWKRPTPPSRPPKTSAPMNQDFRSADCRRSADIDHCECGARPPIFAAPGLYDIGQHITSVRSPYG